MALLRSHPALLLDITGWFAAFGILFLSGGAMFHAAHTALESLRDSAGIHVLVTPDASGLAALDQAIEQLPGVRDARFMVHAVPRSDPADSQHTRGGQRPSLYVHTRTMDPGNLLELAASIREFPQVDAVMYDPDFPARLSDLTTAFGHLTLAIGGAAAILALAAIRIPGIRLVRFYLGEAALYRRLGASRIAAAAPAGVVGAIGGIFGALAAWGAIGLAGTGESTGTHEALQIASGYGLELLVVAGFMGALGPVAAIHRALRSNNAVAPPHPGE
jgi:cell division protein FtsX